MYKYYRGHYDIKFTLQILFAHFESIHIYPECWLNLIKLCFSLLFYIFNAK